VTILDIVFISCSCTLLDMIIFLEDPQPHDPPSQNLRGLRPPTPTRIDAYNTRQSSARHSNTTESLKLFKAKAEAFF